MSAVLPATSCTTSAGVVGVEGVVVRAGGLLQEPCVATGERVLRTAVRCERGWGGVAEARRVRRRGPVGACDPDGDLRARWHVAAGDPLILDRSRVDPDRKSTRLNSSHLGISYA